MCVAPTVGHDVRSQTHRALNAAGAMYSSTCIFAKPKQGNWLSGYRVVISQVLRRYGDAKLTGKLPMAGAARACAHGGPSA